MAAALATGIAGLGLPSSPAAAAAPRQVEYRSWDSADQWAAGTRNGVRIRNGNLRLAEAAAGTRGQYEYGTWVSPWVTPGFTLTELIASWQAHTPGATWVKVEVRGRRPGARSSWDSLGRWAKGDKLFTRSSPGSQTDDLGRVAYDTWLTGGVSAYQLRVTLHRKIDGTNSPRVDAVGAMASRLPSVSGVATSKPGAARGKALGRVLPVPRYSQMVHRNVYPQYDGGGQAWCSPTSLTMVLGYYGALPPASSYRWVRKDYPDRVVAHLARMTYDAGYGGTGNWPFNTAYAATRVGKGAGGAFVTRLRSLREAEKFIAQGIPLIASITFGRGQLDGSPLSSTNGHLLVIVGFRKNGDVVVNDPAAGSRAGVRRVYKRGQFEDAWLRRQTSGSSTSGSGGVVYVVHDRSRSLPPRGSAW